MAQQEHSPEIQTLIDRYGFVSFYDAWMDFAGYPPTWSPEPSAILKVAARLKEAQTRKLIA